MKKILILIIVLIMILTTNVFADINTNISNKYNSINDTFKVCYKENSTYYILSSNEEFTYIQYVSIPQWRIFNEQGIKKYSSIDGITWNLIENYSLSDNKIYLKDNVKVMLYSTHDIKQSDTVFFSQKLPMKPLVQVVENHGMNVLAEVVHLAPTMMILAVGSVGLWKGWLLLKTVLSGA